MNQKKLQHCSFCAWRETCQLRFKKIKEDALNLYCKEFTFDERLKNQDEANMDKKSDDNSRSDKMKKRYFSISDMSDAKKSNLES